MIDSWLVSDTHPAAKAIITEEKRKKKKKKKEEEEEGGGGGEKEEEEEEEEEEGGGGEKEKRRGRKRWCNTGHETATRVIKSQGQCTIPHTLRSHTILGRQHGDSIEHHVNNEGRLNSRRGGCSGNHV